MSTDTMSALLYTIVFAPLVGSIMLGLLSRFLSRRTVFVVGVGAVFLSFVASVVAFSNLLDMRSVTEDAAWTATLFEWIKAGPIEVTFSLYLDPLSAVMVLIITGIGALIHLYSVGYMHDDPSYARYFSHLNLFVFSMLLLVLGKNLLLLFVGWEGVGLCSYLLIGFWFDDMAKAIAGKKAFIVNRIGDFGFLLAIFVLVFWLGGDLDIQLIKQKVADGSITGSTTVTLVTLALFFGATGKSAQIPLYVWLPDAMAGPTPVSALIHAATMVTAGVYMIARLSFLFALAPITLAIVAIIGAVTALFAASIAITQSDIKKVLAYSTVSQLGYMFLGVGVGAFSSGIFHLMTHAFFKACLFLCAGSVIHALGGTQDIYKMGGLKRFMPITRWTFLISALAIAGIPPLSGFFSKDGIVFAALISRHQGLFIQWLGPLLVAIGFAAALLTAFYIFRLYFLVFEGEPHGEAAHESPWTMTVPLMLLAVGAAGAGFFGVHGDSSLFHRWLNPVFVDATRYFAINASEETEYLMMAISSIVAITGLGTAWLMYSGAWREMPHMLASRFTRAYRLLVNKYYVDEGYDAVVIRPFVALARLLHKWLDAFVIDGVGVNGAAIATKGLADSIRRVATGDVQAYVSWVLVGLAVMLWLVT